MLPCSSLMDKRAEDRPVIPLASVCALISLMTVHSGREGYTHLGRSSTRVRGRHLTQISRLRVCVPWRCSVQIMVDAHLVGQVGDSLKRTPWKFFETTHSSLPLILVWLTVVRPQELQSNPLTLPSLRTPLARPDQGTASPSPETP
jgi:hypothetical protein